MQLSKLLQALNTDEVKGIAGREITNITDDSRKVKKASLFVAVKGLTVDGHKFINDAEKNGALVIVGQEDLKNLKLAEKTIYLKVPDSRLALGALASAFYGNPSEKLKVIGVTGTKGKTTTCFLIYHILAGLGQKAGLVTSISAKIGEKEYDTGFHVTNPDTIVLNKFLKEMVDAGCKYAVLEVSSHGIDQKRIAGIRFDIGVLTNIAPEHLDYHKTYEEYKRVKMSFINSAKDKVISPKKTKLNLLVGEFNNLDAEAALVVVEKLGFSRKKALASLKTFKLPEGRMMEVKNNKGLLIYIDFAHTSNSLEAVLKHLRKVTKGKLIAVFGCASERDDSKRPVMGKISANIADFSVFTAEDPRRENINKIISEMVEGVKNTNAKETDIKSIDESIHQYNKHWFIRIPERGEAITVAINKIARKGDAVVICGKGHEKSMSYNGVEYPWSDLEAVKMAFEGNTLKIKRPSVQGSTFSSKGRSSFGQKG